MTKAEIIEEVLNVMLKKVNELKQEYGEYICISLISPAGTIDGYRTGFEAGVKEGMARLLEAVAKEYNREVEMESC